MQQNVEHGVGIGLYLVFLSTVVLALLIYYLVKPMDLKHLFLFRKLAGKTIFITGASRGIGKAIALKAARDGANIVIAAKTTEPHPKLPGTIYTAAKEGKKKTTNVVAFGNLDI